MWLFTTNIEATADQVSRNDIEEFSKLFVLLSLAMVRRDHWFIVNCQLWIEHSCSIVTSPFMRELLRIFCVASLCVVG